MPSTCRRIPARLRFRMLIVVNASGGVVLSPTRGYISSLPKELAADARAHDVNGTQPANATPLPALLSLPGMRHHSKTPTSARCHDEVDVSPVRPPARRFGQLAAAADSRRVTTGWLRLRHGTQHAAFAKGIPIAHVDDISRRSLDVELPSSRVALHAFCRRQPMEPSRGVACTDTIFASSLRPSRRCERMSSTAAGPG